MFESIVNYLSGTGPVMTALIMSTFAMLTTTLGAALVVLVRQLRGYQADILMDVGLGFSSGVMTVATFTSLLLPAIEIEGIWIALLGFATGAIIIAIINRFVPHEHVFKNTLFSIQNKSTIDAKKLRTVWLVALAIIIHNLPEGYAIGVASASDPLEGIQIGTAIGFQDIPEGLAVALPIVAGGGSVRLALFVGWLSGMSEVITAVPASLLFKSHAALAFGLSSAAGAMIYVVSHEALPESHRSGHETSATIGFFAGFIVMLLLDTAFG